MLWILFQLMLASSPAISGKVWQNPANCHVRGIFLSREKNTWVEQLLFQMSRNIYVHSYVCHSPPHPWTTIHIFDHLLERSWGHAWNIHMDRSLDVGNCMYLFPNESFSLNNTPGPNQDSVTIQKLTFSWPICVWEHTVQTKHCLWFALSWSGSVFRSILCWG